MNKIIAAILLALVAIIIAGLVIAPKRQVKSVGSLEAKVECRGGFKWIIDRNGKATEWITSDGYKPTC